MAVVEPGKTYLGVPCEKCGRGLAFDEAPDDPDEGVFLPNALDLTCHVCGHRAMYRPEQVQRFQGRYKQ